MFDLNFFKKYKNKIALINEKDELISYNDLFDLTKNLSEKTNSNSLNFLICDNNFESIIFYIALVSSKSPTLLIDEKTNYEHLKSLIKKYKPNKIFINKNIKSFKDYKEIFSFRNFLVYKRKIKLSLRINKQLLLLVPTSGSTGSAKYVRLSRENLIYNTKSIVKYLKLNKNDTCITTLPMNYVYGLSVINTHLYIGAKIILNRSSVIEKNFWDLIVRHKVTNFAGVPYTYEILNKINFYNKNLKYIKFITQAGGNLNDEVKKNIIEKFTTKSKKFYVMYGAAEATARMSYLPTLNLKNKIGSIGVPIPGGKFWLTNHKGERITKTNDSGELMYSGKNVALGYAKNFKDLSKGDENKGILKTGDIAFRDKDSFYYITGRKDRYVKIFGNRVNLAELEKNISKLGVVSICKFINGFIKIFIKSTKEEEILKANIKNLSNLHLSIFKIKLVNELPLNKNYKLSYNDKILK